MSQAKRKTKPEDALAPLMYRLLREGIFFVLLAVAAYLLLALLSFNAKDPGWAFSNGLKVTNLGGSAGAWFADICLHLFGYVSYLLPLMVAYLGRSILPGRASGVKSTDIQLLRWGGATILLVSACGLGALHFAGQTDSLPVGVGAGGWLGVSVSQLLVSVFNLLGSTLLLLALLFAAIPLFTGTSWFDVMERIGRFALWMAAVLIGLVQAWRENLISRRERQRRTEVVRKHPKRVPPRIEPVLRKIEVGERVQKEQQIQLFDPGVDSELPALSLLDAANPDHHQGYSSDALAAMSKLVELKLGDFGVEAQVVAVHPGPVVTRFELQPAAGVKVAQISNLAKDLARSLSVVSVRVVEIIPGKPTVGVEIPNESREIVRLSEILRSRAYDESSSVLTIALGKDISGEPVVADLGRMPHLLVAGTTGAGKSVALNAMLLSLLYKASPKDVRIIMIDPKMLELSIYQGIAHLLTPVVTDMSEAANALRWCVGEMDNRYRYMAALGVRNIAGYNRKVKEAIAKGEPIADPLYDASKAFNPGAAPPSLEPLPYIVVVVDELADMMMVVGKKVEQLIARIAQKARASGIHLILATQRPSVDVITGLIKANIPTRIAFQVSSKIDSRTILDQMGAEQLLGHGDMLYLPPGTAHPQRVHGAFVDDHEVHKVVEALKKAGAPKYIDAILEDSESVNAAGVSVGDSGAESDPLYDQAVSIVTETRKASISYVQRTLRVGYNRAARMIEDMEAAGIVSTLQSNGVREVLAPPPPKG